MLKNVALDASSVLLASVTSNSMKWLPAQSQVYLISMCSRTGYTACTQSCLHNKLGRQTDMHNVSIYSNKHQYVKPFDNKLLMLDSFYLFRHVSIHVRMHG
jgi:hypothetical protein